MPRSGPSVGNSDGNHGESERDKYKEYARYAEHCLGMAPAATDQDAAGYSTRNGGRMDKASGRHRAAGHDARKCRWSDVGRRVGRLRQSAPQRLKDPHSAAPPATIKSARRQRNASTFKSRPLMGPRSRPERSSPRVICAGPGSDAKRATTGKRRISARAKSPSSAQSCRSADPRTCVLGVIDAVCDDILPRRNVTMAEGRIIESVTSAGPNCLPTRLAIRPCHEPA